AHAEHSAPATGDFRVVAYVANWSIPPVIHARKLTHINFAFARIDPNGRVAFEPLASAAGLEGLLALRDENPALRILVSVGGWQAEGFSDAALTDASRSIFASSAVALLGKY